MSKRGFFLFPFKPPYFCNPESQKKTPQKQKETKDHTEPPKKSFTPQKYFLLPINTTRVGDHFLLKRIKANLSQPEVALNAGVSERMVRAWEHDQLLPTEAEWKVLEAILGLDSTFPKS